MARADPNAIGHDPDDALYGEPRGIGHHRVNSELLRINQILFNQTAELQHVATARIEWTGLHDTLSIAALGFVNFTTHEWLAAPKIGYKLSDQMTAYLGAESSTVPRARCSASSTRR